MEEAALELARQQCEQDAIRRRAQATRRQARTEGEDQAYTARFTQRIIELFPGCPQAEALSSKPPLSRLPLVPGSWASS